MSYSVKNYKKIKIALKLAISVLLSEQLSQSQFTDNTIIPTNRINRIILYLKV